MDTSGILHFVALEKKDLQFEIGLEQEFGELLVEILSQLRVVTEVQDPDAPQLHRSNDFLRANRIQTGPTEIELLNLHTRADSVAECVCVLRRQKLIFDVDLLRTRLLADESHAPRVLVLKVGIEVVLNQRVSDLFVPELGYLNLTLRSLVSVQLLLGDLVLLGDHEFLEFLREVLIGFPQQILGFLLS